MSYIETGNLPPALAAELALLTPLERHGGRALLGAALRLGINHRRWRQVAPDNAHLRRDIGLPERAEQQHPVSFDPFC
ncbi:MAG: hypothetical protein P8X51_18960 [Maritimibacter sp.]